MGLSPRVRGNHAKSKAAHAPVGSIPAGAGEPPLAEGQRLGAGVYPRGCGGTRVQGDIGEGQGGLSPRVRGNLGGLTAAQGAFRSIPAGAGEPQSHWTRPRISEVYPRGCGGTAYASGWHLSGCGLSPRVRGNPSASPTPVYTPGSIPAGAGEPGVLRDPGRQLEVYPRGCGGTTWPTAAARGAEGLSPRVRGNQDGEGGRPGGDGSIPAGAGEPPVHTPVATGPRGLSPRVRGNRPKVKNWLVCSGSIPAGAGEPPVPHPTFPTFMVYPRGCGGTQGYPLCTAQRHGLSPRVRGNHHRPPAPKAGARSIPAGAGEPQGRCGRFVTG